MVRSSAVSWLPWRSAGPLLLALLAYRRTLLPSRVMEELEKGADKEGHDVSPRTTDSTSKPRVYSSWWSWGRSNSANKHAKTLAKDSVENKLELPQIEPVSELNVESKSEAGQIEPTTEDVVESPAPLLEAVALDERTHENTEIVDDHVNEEQHENSSSESEPEGKQGPTRRHSSFRKTLRLSSEQIKNLNLRDGMNEMVFSVTTAYQGTTVCKCNVFRWRYDDKIVISDIDGTITKSDVLGHIFPLVGKDWAQSGVTREYLRSIRQGHFIARLSRKKPEEFKIQCLADIKALFPPGSNPFYAGYGNRVNDVCAYQAVGIPIVRIFTINYKGELKHELTQTFQSTYSHMSVLVDQVFPPTLCEPSDEFSHTVYWREPLPIVDLPSVALTSAKHN
ncbi:hypothetical protein ACJJTC_002818 [Scirpophaga incertulas]